MSSAVPAGDVDDLKTFGAEVREDLVEFGPLHAECGGGLFNG